MIPLRSVLKNPLCLALPVVVGGTLLCLWQAWCEFPIYSWNEARLAPAFALRHGINPYPPIGGGPLSTWIYGPTGIVINLPATFAADAPGALQAACLINFAVLIAPLAWIFFRTQEQPPGRAHPLGWFALAIAILLLPRAYLILQVADHTAIAFGIFSCGFLTRAARPTTLDLCAAAGAGILAVWSKQIEVFLIAAQFAYLLAFRDRLVVARYFLWLLAFGAFSLGVVAGCFGWNNIWLNLVVIPGRLPWADDITGRIAMRSRELIAQLAVPCAGLAWLYFAKHWPTRETQQGRFFLVTIFAYFAMLPVGLAAFLKTGGDLNLFHSWDYLLPGCLLAWLAAEKITATARRYWIFALTALCLSLRREDIFSLPSRPLTAHFDSANKLIAAYAPHIWFPRNPIITFYADNKLWHSEDGVETRFLASYSLREVEFRRYLPPELQAVAYPAKVETPFSIQLLREFSKKTSVPYWSVYRRATDGRLPQE